tara:strand:- start:279 stop:1355 length:1077 start_codon:yes stop_codon:yes gene_type:complete
MKEKVNMNKVTKEDLKKLTIIQLKELGKKHNIKGTSNKKKNILINYLYQEINKRIDNDKLNDLVDNIILNINHNREFDEEKINEDLNQYIDNISDKLSDIDVKEKPQYYFYKFDYLNNELNIKIVESLLNKKLNIGDIVQFDDYRAKGSFVVNNNNDLIECSGFISDDIYIPLEVSSEFDDPISIYKNIHPDFYGIELSKDDKYIKDKFGIFESNENWKFYYVNQDIFENEIHVDIGLDDVVQLSFDVQNNNKYAKFMNSIDYLKRLYFINNQENESYGFYITFENNSEELDEQENQYLYDVNIPEYCTLNIEYQCEYFELRYSYLRKQKDDMLKFINEYYFSDKKDFIKEIEPIIEE